MILFVRIVVRWYLVIICNSICWWELMWDDTLVLYVDESWEVITCYYMLTKCSKCFLYINKNITTWNCCFLLLLVCITKRGAIFQGCVDVLYGWPITGMCGRTLWVVHHRDVWTYFMVAHHRDVWTYFMGGPSQGYVGGPSQCVRTLWVVHHKGCVDVLYGWSMCVDVLYGWSITGMCGRTLWVVHHRDVWTYFMGGPSQGCVYVLYGCVVLYGWSITGMCGHFMGCVDVLYGWPITGMCGRTLWVAHHRDVCTLWVVPRTLWVVHHRDVCDVLYYGWSHHRDVWTYFMGGPSQGCVDVLYGWSITGMCGRTLWVVHHRGMCGRTLWVVHHRDVDAKNSNVKIAQK